MLGVYCVTDVHIYFDYVYIFGTNFLVFSSYSNIFFCIYNFLGFQLYFLSFRYFLFFLDFGSRFSIMIIFLDCIFCVFGFFKYLGFYKVLGFRIIMNFLHVATGLVKVRYMVFDSVENIYVTFVSTC